MLDQKKITGNYLVPYLGNSNVRWDFVNIDDLPKMDILPSEYKRFILQKGDLLVCEGGDDGRTAIWRVELEICAYQKALHRLSPKPLKNPDNPRFLYYLMRAASSLGAFIAGGNPNTIIHLTGNQLRAHKFPFPPVDEQIRIIEYLDEKTSQIEFSMKYIIEQIRNLKEYRSLLISAAVTGKIDVRSL